MRQDEALDALERAETVDTRVRARGRWYASYCAAYAAMSCGLILALGLMPSVATVAWATPLFLLAAAGLTVFALRQPVQPRGYGALHGGMMAAWGGVYLLTLLVGANAFQGEPWWWVAGAVVSMVPPLVAAGIALRRSGNA